MSVRCFKIGCWLGLFLSIMRVGADSPHGLDLQKFVASACKFMAEHKKSAIIACSCIALTGACCCAYSYRTLLLRTAKLLGKSIGTQRRGTRNLRGAGNTNHADTIFDGLDRIEGAQGNQEASNRIFASLMAAASGDALGRVTEFLKSMDAINHKYPQGIRSFDDLKKTNDFFVKDGRSVAPYTDDTRMAMLVMHELIKFRQWAHVQAKAKGQSDLSFIRANYDQASHKLMTSIALSFIKDFKNRSYGWAAGFRAPGNACMAGTKNLIGRLNKMFDDQKYPEDTSKYPQNWWKLTNDAGGCGSVMRAYPFGLVFYDDPDLAARLAHDHSYMSHGCPLARSACAAMAAGTAYAVREEGHTQIVEQMYAYAKQYDDPTYKAQTAVLIEQAISMSQDGTPTAQVFEKLQGWSAHEAIAAAVYILCMHPADVQKAVLMGVYTPGDSDSIASLAGALVGARVGKDKIPQDWIDSVEDSNILQLMAKKAA